MTYLLSAAVCVLLLVWLESRRRHREYWHGPNYCQQIEALKPTDKEALKLPPIRALKGQRESDKVWRKLRRVG